MKKNAVFVILIFLFVTALTAGAGEISEITGLGWSKNGKLAYVTKEYWHSPVPSSGYNFEYVIFNAVTDEILWKNRDVVEVESAIEDIKHESGDPYVVSWRRMKNTVNSQLAKYGIIVLEVKFKRFPLEYTNDIGYLYNASIKNAARENNIFTFDVWVYAVHQSEYETAKSKKVSTVKLERYWLPNKCEVTGYFLSPYEPRAAVVYEMSGRGFETEPFSEIGMTGAHLTYNFKPDSTYDGPGMPK